VMVDGRGDGKQCAEPQQSVVGRVIISTGERSRLGVARISQHCPIRSPLSLSPNTQHPPPLQHPICPILYAFKTRIHSTRCTFTWQRIRLRFPPISLLILWQTVLRKCVSLSHSQPPDLSASVPRHFFVKFCFPARASSA